MRSTTATKVFLFAILAAFLISCKTPAYTRKSDPENAADSVKAATLGAFGLEGAAKEQQVDMQQFRRKALNIAYANSGYPRQTLDIIYPSAGEAPYKFVVVFHSGGWAAGDKRSETLAPIFQAITQGYAVVSVNYRLSDEVTWPKPLHDAKAAIRYLRANAFKHLLDASNIVVWGVSSGGHLAEMLAATNNQPAFEDAGLGNPGTSSAVQGVVSWYGIPDVSELTAAGIPAANKLMGFEVKSNKEKTREANPVALVTKDFPPILLVHGTNDQVVPFAQAVNMQTKVNESTGRMIATLKRVEGAGHGDSTIRTNQIVSNCLDFVDRILFNGKNPHRNTNYIAISIGE